MIFKPYYYFETGCAAYLFGCGGLGKCAVVDAHEEDVDGGHHPVEQVRHRDGQGEAQDLASHLSPLDRFPVRHAIVSQRKPSVVRTDRVH